MLLVRRHVTLEYDHFSYFDGFTRWKIVRLEAVYIFSSHFLAYPFTKTNPFVVDNNSVWHLLSFTIFDTQNRAREHHTHPLKFVEHPNLSSVYYTRSSL